jgi:hypothetical protein
MRTILILITSLMLSAFTYAQDFDRYENNPGITSVIINKNMFKLMTKLDLDSKDEEVQQYVELIQNLEDIKIFKTNNSDMSDDLNKDAESYAKKNKLEELMRVRDGDNKIAFLFKPGKTDDQISQLFMHINGMEEDNETVLIIINGLIDLNQVSKLANDLNVPGADSLNN